MTQILQEERTKNEQTQVQDAAVHRKGKYDGLMTYSDKKHIAKIQLFQLQTENPYLDDFYYQAYIKRETSQPPKPLTSSTLKLKVTPNQLPRPKRDADSVSVQGALGSIPRHSVNRPRILFQMSAGEGAEGGEGQAPREAANPLNMVRSEKQITKTKQVRVLKAIEGLYNLILKVEDIQFHLASITEEESRAEEFDKLAQIMDQIHTTLTSPLEGMSREDTLVYFLRYGKGIKVIGRALALFSQEKVFAFLITLLRIFDQLNILDPQAPSDMVAAFLKGILQPVSMVFEKIGLAKLTSCLEIIVGHSLFGVFSIARSKVGLAFFEMMFVRAHQLKFEQVEYKELERWGSVFSSFFVILESNYNNLLLSTEKYLSSDIWGFFTLLALHSSAEQRYSLLSEIRERVLELVRGGTGAHRQAVVHFLSAMGINANDLMV